MRTTKRLQRFYVVEVFRPQPPIPGSQGSETVSLPYGTSAFDQRQYTTRVTVRASKGRALQLAHAVSTIFFSSKPTGFGWSIHRGEMMKTVLQLAAFALLTSTAFGQ